jgi:hypothetical protein
LVRSEILKGKKKRKEKTRASELGGREGVFIPIAM